MDGQHHQNQHHYSQQQNAPNKQQQPALAPHTQHQPVYTQYSPATSSAPLQPFNPPPPPPPAHSNQHTSSPWHPNWSHQPYRPPPAPLHSYTPYQTASTSASGMAGGLTGAGEDELEVGSFGHQGWETQPHQRRDSTSSVQYGLYQASQLGDIYQRRGSMPQQSKVPSHDPNSHFPPAQPHTYPIPTHYRSSAQFDSLNLGMGTSAGLPGPAKLANSYLPRPFNQDHLAPASRQSQHLMMPPPARPRSAQPPLTINTQSSITPEVSQGPYSAAARLSGYPAPTPLQPGLAVPTNYSPVESQPNPIVHGSAGNDWRRTSLYGSLAPGEGHGGVSSLSTPSLPSLPSNSSSASLHNLPRSRAPSHPSDYPHPHHHTHSPAVGSVGSYDHHLHSRTSSQAGPSALAPASTVQPSAFSLPPPVPGSALRTQRSRSATSLTPAEVDPLLPIVQLATEQRRLMSGMPSSANKKNRTVLDPLKSPDEGEFAAQPAASSSLPESKVVEKAGKVTITMSVACWRCASPLAGLTLRGSRSQFGEAYHAAYFCLQCGPLDESDSETDTAQEKKGDDEFLTYEHTFSAALDRLQGLSIEPDDPRPKAVRSSRPAPAGSKRKKDDAHLQCDVCMRTIGSGGMYLSERRELIEFQIEVICVPCSQRYRRCSDCGGGGGPRLGVGKWRCKELFEEGRKNCILSHHRQGADQEQTFDVWQMREVPRHELDELVEQCRNLYSQAMMAMVANPELLEAHRPMARNFTEVLKLAGDWWSAFIPSFREDIEPTKGIRRYIGLRWSSPALRKKAKAKAAGGRRASGEEQDEEEEWGRPESVIRKGKVLSSYIIAEWDINKGSMFVSLVMPKGTGHTYDANTTLMAHIARQIEHDALALHRLNPAVPLLTEVWTMLVVVKESHFLNRDGGRRGFIPVDDYIADGGDPTHFPPHREVYLPMEFLKGWKVMARRWWPGAELVPPAPSKARKKKPAVAVKEEQQQQGAGEHNRHSGLEGARTASY